MKKLLKRKSIIALGLCILLSVNLIGCKGYVLPDSGTTVVSNKPDTETLSECKYQEYKNLTAEEIVSKLSLDEKAAQMVMPQLGRISDEQMHEHCYGAVLSKIDTLDYLGWQGVVDSLQTDAVTSDAGIPMIYGQDDVHGVNYALNTVIFPHNIGMGAANDKELMYKVGQITGEEALMCHMIWNYSPCVAQSEDPRWGRTYESYGADLDIIKNLSTEYTKGLLDAGMIVCAKHFFGDGNVEYGTGEKTMLDMIIDRGNATLSDEEIDDLLSVYQALIDTGAQSFMASHSSLNGTKMHENAKYLQYLKNDMGFDGFVCGDWNSVQNTSPETYYDQVVTSVNAGIDLLMEVDDFEEVRGYIVKAVSNGDISEDRVNDAATRIIRVKLEAGVFDDPFFENLKTKESEPGSKEYREVAEKLVEESLVLLKNNNNVLPLQKGTKVYITGPAANNAQAQCGGWTIDWNNSPSIDIPGVTTIEKGFLDKADEYGIEVSTDKKKADEADVVLLVVGEQAYAEWNGDTKDLQLCGMLGLDGNKEAIEEAKKLGKPVVACIVAGRQVIISDYYDDWDGVVMCYLPGSEGQGVADVLCGGSDFNGKIPSPWYSSLEQIGTDKPWLEIGYGLTYESK